MYVCLPAEIIGQADTDHVDVVERLGGVKCRAAAVGHAEISVVQADVKILDAATEVVGEGVLKTAARCPAIDPLAVAFGALT